MSTRKNSSFIFLCAILCVSESSYVTVCIEQTEIGEILKIRKELYPELKKARDAGKKAKLVKDKLIIEGQIFYKPAT
jgi:hypothetical protein